MNKTLNVKAIRIDGGTQSRVEIDNEIVAEYADAIRAKASFPPMVVFHDGADHWLADGFHRWHAYNAAGKASVEVDVRAGTVRDAILFSFGANGAHGLRRSNADKRKAVESMLADSEWVKWSSNAIAKACGVSHTFVDGVRASILQPLQDRPAIRVAERNGKFYEQSTKNIGKTVVKTDAPPASKVAPSPAPAAKTTPPPPSKDVPAEFADVDVDAAMSDIDPMDEIKRLQADNRHLEERVKALQASDLAAELAKQVQIRQGIEGRLNFEMEKVNQLQRELDSYGKWYAELRKITGKDRRSEITRIVREAREAA